MDSLQDLGHFVKVCPSFVCFSNKCKTNIFSCYYDEKILSPWTDYIFESAIHGMLDEFLFRATKNDLYPKELYQQFSDQYVIYRNNGMTSAFAALKAVESIDQPLNKLPIDLPFSKQILEAKFAQGTIARQALDLTKGMYIGVLDSKANTLGDMLMSIRDDIIEEPKEYVEWLQTYNNCDNLCSACLSKLKCHDIINNFNNVKLLIITN
jgi:hypothetical protein